MTVYIYDLCDPRTGEVRYIGKSVDPKERLASHIRESRKATAVHSRSWIRGLLQIGEVPLLGILEECSSRETADEAERFWIASFRLMGARLTNMTQGGDGQSPGYVPSREARQKISRSIKGRKASPEVRARLKEAFNTPEMKKRRRQIVEELKQSNPEWLEKVRRGRSGKPITEEHKQKLSASWTKERKEKHAAEKSALPFDDRWKSQLDAARKARWEKFRASGGEISDKHRAGLAKGRHARWGSEKTAEGLRKCSPTE